MKDCSAELASIEKRKKREASTSTGWCGLLMDRKLFEYMCCPGPVKDSPTRQLISE